MVEYVKATIHLAAAICDLVQSLADFVNIMSSDPWHGPEVFIFYTVLDFKASNPLFILSMSYLCRVYIK